MPETPLGVKILGILALLGGVGALLLSLFVGFMGISEGNLKMLGLSIGILVYSTITLGAAINMPKMTRKGWLLGMYSGAIGLGVNIAGSIIANTSSSSGVGSIIMIVYLLAKKNKFKNELG